MTGRGLDECELISLEFVQGESNASMVQEEGESNASMVQEEGESNASMVHEEAELKACMVQGAVLLRTQPNEEGPSRDNTFPLVRKSTVPLEVSSYSTDAEPPILSGDSSDAEPDTSRDDSMSDMSFIGSTSGSLCNKPSENSDEGLEKYIKKMPTELTIEPVHCLIMCTKEDIGGAEKFRKHLIRDIKIKHGPVTAVLDKGPEFIPLPGGVFSRADECFNRGILTLIYMTENLIKDKKMLHIIESCFTESLNHVDKKWTFFPVYSRKEDKNLPFPNYLKSLTDIDYFNQDEHYRGNVASLIEAKSSAFVKANKLLKQRQKEWITENCKTGGIQETQMKSAGETKTCMNTLKMVSIPGLDDNNKIRWHTVGLCLNIVLSNALQHVSPLIEKVFKDLKISKQTKDNFKKEHGATLLSYKVINGNAGRKKEEYDYDISNAVDFSKCLLPHQAPKYKDFNDSCKLETRLYFLTDIELPSITADCKKLAKNVVDIRNKWAHCDFLEWTDDFYRSAFDLIKKLLKNLKLKPEEENRFLGDIEEMKDHGNNLIDGKTYDSSLLKVLRKQTEELCKCVTEEKKVMAEMEKIIKLLTNELATLMVHSSPTVSKVKNS